MCDFAEDPEQVRKLLVGRVLTVESQPVADPMETVQAIKEIGPERCIIGSDFGQVMHMDTVDGMRVFLRALLAFGIKKEDVRKRLVDNPAKLMWLD